MPETYPWDGLTKAIDQLEETVDKLPEDIDGVARNVTDVVSASVTAGPNGEIEVTATSAPTGGLLSIPVLRAYADGQGIILSPGNRGAASSEHYSGTLPGDPMSSVTVNSNYGGSVVTRVATFE